MRSRPETMQKAQPSHRCLYLKARADGAEVPKGLSLSTKGFKDMFIRVSEG